MLARPDAADAAPSANAGIWFYRCAGEAKGAQSCLVFALLWLAMYMLSGHVEAGSFAV